MLSTKAAVLDQEAKRLGLGLLRFDYSGHGRSEGRLEDGTISRWLEETLAIVRAETEGPQIVLGSSMGGYFALLASGALNRSGEGHRLAGLILVAPAVDFSEALIWERAPDEARRAIMEEGGWRRPSPYSDAPDWFSRALIEDGRNHLLFRGMIRTGCPTVVLQGMRDEDVPYQHALQLMQRLGSDPATLTLIKDGDHRLSRPQDLRLLIDALERMSEVVSPLRPADRAQAESDDAAALAEADSQRCGQAAHERPASGGRRLRPPGRTLPSPRAGLEEVLLKK
jgi:alpha-beta hydrolase superfamily lysophospholipase